MPDTRVEDEVAAAALTGAEILYCVQAASPRNVTIDRVAAYAANPPASDGRGLGTAALQWSDLFLASGAVLDYGGGDLIWTHSTGKINLNRPGTALDGTGIGAFSVTQAGPAAGSITVTQGQNYVLFTGTHRSTVTSLTNTDPFADRGYWSNSVQLVRANLTTGGANVGAGVGAAGGTITPLFGHVIVDQASNTINDFVGITGVGYSNVANIGTGGLYGGAVAVGMGAAGSWDHMTGFEIDGSMAVGSLARNYRSALNLVNQGPSRAAGALDTAILAASGNIGGSFKNLINIGLTGGINPVTQHLFTAGAAFTLAGDVFNLPTMTVTGNILTFPNVTLTGSGRLALVAGGDKAIVLRNLTDALTYNVVSVNTDTTAVGTMGMYGGANADLTLYLQSPTGFIRMNHNGHTSNFTINGGLGINTNSDPGAGLIYLNAAGFLMRNKTAWTNGAGASAGTLTNAPAAGNPTKWIAIDDNGTTRQIPAW